MHPQQPYTGYPPQYSPYPYQPYYSSPYYNPYYPPQAPPAPRGPASATTGVPPLDQNTPPPVSSIEAAEDPEDLLQPPQVFLLWTKTPLLLCRVSRLLRTLKTCFSHHRCSSSGPKHPSSCVEYR